jgi:hypothetical protein
MSEDLAVQYFEWLYAHVSNPAVKSPKKTYWNLLRQLHDKEFVYIIPNDDNRWFDGRDLRSEFWADVSTGPIPVRWPGPACSMLEMLVSLAKRLEFQTDEFLSSWFWTLLQNLDIAHFNDSTYNEPAARYIDEVLDNVIWRRYTYSGEGGLFPLGKSMQDQTKLEIWYQMHSYLLEAI